MDKVVHFEIPFDDHDKAKEFYEKVFDWQLEDMKEMPYTIARSVEVDDQFMPKESGAINGGMYKREEGSGDKPVIVIQVESIDGKVKKIEENGGSLYREKVKVGEMGLYAQVKDNQGNVIGLWEPLREENKV